MKQNITNLLGFTGSFLIIIGVFCPALEMPFEGPVTFINKWIGSGILVILLGFSSGLLSFFGKAKLLWLPAFTIGIVLLFHLYDLKQKLDQYSFGNTFLKNNIKSLISLEWGWFLLIAGVSLFLLSSILSYKRDKVFN